MTPMPPCCASAIARAASVTVSIAEEHNGIWSWMLRVNCVDVSVSFGKTSERAGTKSTSSNVRPSGSSTEIIQCYRLLKDQYEMKLINENTTARYFGAGSRKVLIFLTMWPEIAVGRAHAYVPGPVAQTLSTNNY